MGREAFCRCEWASTTADVKVLLETRELLVRGAMKRKVPFSEMREVSAHGDQLTFRVGEERVSLSLGAANAVRWAKAIATPPSLAQKLGIKSATRLRVIGEISDTELKTAIAQGSPANGADVDLIIASVRTRRDLENVVTACEAEIVAGAPLWLAYPKGQGKELTESDVRETLRQRGLVDTKVAAVSAELTALRFSTRKQKQSE